MRIQPKPTEYKGVKFRSKLESLWARHLDCLGVPWKYETQAFNTSLGGYLPDFWLPSLGMWAEVKPCAFSDRELVKLKDVVSASGHPALLLSGAPTSSVSVAMPVEDMEDMSEYRGITLKKYILRAASRRSDHEQAGL